MRRPRFHIETQAERVRTTTRELAALEGIDYDALPQPTAAERAQNLVRSRRLERDLLHGTGSPVPTGRGIPNASRSH